VNPGPTLRWLFGISFHLMERPVLAFIAPDVGVSIALPAMEVSRLGDSEIPIEACPYGEDPGTWSAAVQRALDSVGLSGARVAIEPRSLRALELDILREAAPDLKPTSDPDFFEGLRAAKSVEEVAHIRKAVAIAESALRETIPSIKGGVTERAIANKLVEALLRAGSDPTLPFAPIVATGAHTADPHAEPSDRAITRGDCVLIDWGAAWRGYCSDLTRVFCVGEPEQELQKVAELVAKANEAARAAAAPGAPASLVDAAARNVIESGGHGDRFIHRTGHGIGLEVHEAPYIRRDSRTTLQAGMVFTVEPGVYLGGRFGVRIEDDIMITEDGSETLSGIDRKLVVLPYAP